MDAKLKDLWLKALRSGEYRQGSIFLRRRDGTFCCLGVLCEIAAKTGRLPAGVSISENNGYLTCDGSAHSIPENLFGLDRSLVDQAIARNDGRRETFSQIADWPETAVSTDEPKA